MRLTLTSGHGLNARASWHAFAASAIAALVTTSAVADPYVEFDFARAVESCDVTSRSDSSESARHRLVRLALPVSVRFHGLATDDVDELNIEINGAAAGLRVVDFAPATQLASDVAKPIETTTTTTRSRSLDATLGGELPLPYAEVVAHVAPSISAGLAGSETAVEKMNRLPPKHAVVVSGTSSEGRGVFFKLKRSSQTSLEGVHELSVTFVVPAEWRGGEVRVGCSARGRRKVLWMKQPATLGGAAGAVRVYAPGRAPVYQVAKPVITQSAAAPDAPRGSVFMAAAAEVVEMFGGTPAAKPQAAK
jgi:hypothetical protein